MADEIKELANQAKKATDDIKERIGSIRDSSDKTSGEIREIISIINEVSGSADSLADLGGKLKAMVERFKL